MQQNTQLQMVLHPRTVFGINLQWLYGLKDRNTGIYIYRPENYK